MQINIEKAENPEFAHWWAIYRNVNEDYSQGFAEQAQDIVSVPFCHWILADGKRIGGFITVPNNIGDFFLVHPFTDAYRALKAIIPQVKTNGTITARNVLDTHCHAFQLLGFQTVESRRWMIRPTQAYDLVTFDDLTRIAPQSEQTEDIARLMLTAFEGGAGQYGQRKIDAHQNSVENYFKTIADDDSCHQASSVIMDGDKMVSACLIQRYKSLVTVRFVVTHPDYQGRGLAQKQIQHGINAIKDEYKTVALAVTIGNPAEALYHKMGFVSGAITHTLQC